MGYGGTYTTTADEVIGTIPIGYADGWTRDLQGFHVIVDGQLCPIVGRVSMDQITVRLPKVYPLGTPLLWVKMGEQASLRQRWLKNVALSTTRSFVCLVIVYLVAMTNINNEKSSLILDFLILVKSIFMCYNS